MEHRLWEGEVDVPELLQPFLVHLLLDERLADGRRELVDDVEGRAWAEVRMDGVDGVDGTARVGAK